ncbi:MAG: site-specific DNA-methyltransferase [Candidatus Lokiarchaeota archaeon]|nr:site-specific DNA-methyltransferase [Candidatus Harpocratesius repetitus]
MLNQPNSMERNESPNNSHQIQQNPLNKLNQKKKNVEIKNTRISTESTKTLIELFILKDIQIPKYTNEFWTSKQRQASSLHEISYRACFKPQLPRFFINLLSKPKDIIYDPFSGRGTTVIEAGILGRNIIQNDINPLSQILCQPRFFLPKLDEIQKRLKEIPIDYSAKAEIDLSMFYHKKTESEIVSLKKYLQKRIENKEEDDIDRWIRMVATNRLTGHSQGFFSVYTLPPNQAVSQSSQIKINKKRNQTPEYKEIFSRILKKSKSLLRNISEIQKENLEKTGRKGIFLSKNAKDTNEIENDSVQLIVTSPPFLKVVDYSSDNWLRCWFNSIDTKSISEKITVTSSIDIWVNEMTKIFYEFYRIVKPNGWIAFEVGELDKGKINLDEIVVPIGKNTSFTPKAIIVNQQSFTKTSNIWGIKNNKRGTNTNRIVLFQKT